MLAFPQVEIASKPVQIGRFLSSTRVAAHGKDGASFWNPIANDNSQAIVKAAQIFSKKLDGIKFWIRHNDKKGFEGELKHAHEYVRGIKQDRDFEGIEGDVYDLMAQRKPNLPTNIDDILGQELDIELEAYVASHIAMPVIFATASVQLASEYEHKGGQPFSSIGNSSFQDSIRPMRDQFSFFADYVWSRKQAVLAVVEKFQTKHGEIIKVIKEGGDVTEYIRSSHEIRAQLPEAPKEARPEFTTLG